MQELLLKIKELKEEYSVIITTNRDVNSFKVYAITKKVNAWIPSTMLFGINFILDSMAHIIIEATIDDSSNLSMSILKDRTGLQFV